ncbi:zinc finger protein ZAT3-like [Momordica charantia]|uniref:Zinc finger protein ZAT3-like n=1 Tax=Momordica charantia TaxID=3673 RepID=A0A6J1CQU4_MOMCH|nr:zinc finger protein ZAT3-like [Momordica charantia]
MADGGNNGVVIEVKLSINSSKCGLCGKLFRTMKALYGHMRSHPDRTWRGMHPTPSSSSSSAAASTPLPTWSVTGRRGRKRTSSAAASTSNSNDEHDSSSKKKVHVYRCNVCGKEFWSPQALGGHKSSHYKPEKTDFVVQTSSSGRRTVDFDLNELPPMDDHGEAD